MNLDRTEQTAGEGPLRAGKRPHWRALVAGPIGVRSDPQLQAAVDGVCSSRPARQLARMLLPSPGWALPTHTSRKGAAWQPRLCANTWPACACALQTPGGGGGLLCAAS